MVSLEKEAWKYEKPPAGILELWERVQIEWDKLGAKDCQNIIKSMPDRCKAVIRAKGGHTKY